LTVARLDRGERDESPLDERRGEPEQRRRREGLALSERSKSKGEVAERLKAAVC